MTDPKALLDNGAFCALPYIHDFRHLDGKKHLCCIAYGENLPLDEDINSDSTRELRKKIFNGEKIPHCNVCYKQEAAGITSYRQSQTAEWIVRDSETQEYFNTLTPDTPPKLFYYDIRYDAKCNLSCITCGPEFSTLWKKELNIPIVEYQLDSRFEDMLQAKKIYLAGGEPLVIDQHIELLRWLSVNHPDVEIIINTNLMGLKPDVLEILKNLKNLGLVVSVDSWGPTLEYVRYPLRWDKFLRNLDAVKEAGITFYFNTVASAVSVFGWSEFNKLESYNPKDWYLFPIEHPYWYKLENIPETLKQKAYNSILTMKDTKFYQTSERFKTEVDHCLTRVMQAGTSKDLVREIGFIDQRRKIDHSTYLGVNLINPQ